MGVILALAPSKLPRWLRAQGDTEVANIAQSMQVHLPFRRGLTWVLWVDTWLQVLI